MKTTRGKHRAIQRSRRVLPSEKAAFHQITGAGKSHVKREFFGLTDSDKDAITALIMKRIDEKFNRGG